MLLPADFSAAHDTINGMLQRFQLVDDTLHVNSRTKTQTVGGSSSSPTASARSSRSLQPSTPPLRPASAPHRQQQSARLRLTARSRLLFEAPAPACHTPSSTKSKGSSSAARSSSGSGGSAGTAEISQQQDRQLAAYGGCIDLNPGFAFRPGMCVCVLAAYQLLWPAATSTGTQSAPVDLHAAGTAERTAAVLRHAVPTAAAAGDGHTAAPAVATVQAAVAAAFAPRLCSLTHREQLQAGIQQKNAVFYGAIRQQQWQQHKQQVQELWEQAEVIPVSWFLGV